MKYIKYFLIGVLILLLIIQFFRIDKTNPPADPSADLITNLQPPEDVSIMIKLACYDCHSNHTKYPWYTNIAPISFWIKGHIKHAREELNFSEWTSYDAKKAHHKLEECYEKVMEGHMPLPSYTWMHSESKLSDKQRTVLANWFRGQMAFIEDN